MLPCVFSHFGAIPPRSCKCQTQKEAGVEFWPLGNPFDCNYLKNGSSEHLVSAGFKISAKRAFQKCKVWGITH